MRVQDLRCIEAPPRRSHDRVVAQIGGQFCAAGVENPITQGKVATRRHGSGGTARAQETAPRQVVQRSMPSINC
jgi:hypothetical protein